MAAHNLYPFGTRLRVVTRHGRSIVVIVVDRGPFAHGRDIDLTPRGADLLGIRRAGVARVTVTPVGFDPRYKEHFASR